MVLGVAGSRKVSTSHVHRNQPFHKSKQSRVRVPKVFNEGLHAQDDTNRDNREDQPRHQIAQNQRLLRVADVSLPMPIIRAVPPHGKSALVLAEHGHLGFEEVCDDEGTEHRQ